MDSQLSSLQLPGISGPALLAFLTYTIWLLYSLLSADAWVFEVEIGCINGCPTHTDSTVVYLASHQAEVLVLQGKSVPTTIQKSVFWQRFKDSQELLVCHELKRQACEMETPDCTCPDLASAGAWPLGLVGSRRRIPAAIGQGISLATCPTSQDWAPRFLWRSALASQVSLGLRAFSWLHPMPEGTLSSSFQLSWIWLHLSLVASWTEPQNRNCFTFIDSAFKSHALIFAFKMVFYNIDEWKKLANDLNLKIFYRKHYIIYLKLRQVERRLLGKKKEKKLGIYL